MFKRVLKIKLLISGLLLVCMPQACTYEKVYPEVCFQEDILPVFVSNCTMAGCHNAIDHEEGLDLSNYEGIMEEIKPGDPWDSKIFEVISGDNPEMPPGIKLDKQDVANIYIWIKKGAPNSTNCKACDTSSTFSGRIKPLLTDWCMGCHNGGSSGGGYNFTDYNGVLATVNAGVMLGAINHQGGFTAMPQNAPKLSQCDIDAITKWVNAGAPNN